VKITSGGIRSHLTDISANQVVRQRAGTPAEKPTRINGPLKHVWRSIPESEGVIGWQNVKKPPMLLKSVETKVEGAPQ